MLDWQASPTTPRRSRPNKPGFPTHVETQLISTRPNKNAPLFIYQSQWVWRERENEVGFEKLPKINVFFTPIWNAAENCQLLCTGFDTIACILRFFISDLGITCSWNPDVFRARKQNKWSSANPIQKVGQISGSIMMRLCACSMRCWWQMSNLCHLNRKGTSSQHVFTCTQIYLLFLINMSAINDNMQSNASKFSDKNSKTCLTRNEAEHWNGCQRV